MTINFCLCGTQQSGYPHHKHCPFPLYSVAHQSVARRWKFAFKLATSKSLALEDVFTFGKYQNESVGNVIEDDPTYIDWALDEIPNFSLDAEAKSELEKASHLQDPLEDIF